MAAQPSFSGGFHHTVHFSAVIPVNRMGPSTGPGVSKCKQKLEEFGHERVSVLWQIPPQCLPTLYSDVDVSFPATGAVLGLHGVNATVVPVSITDEKTAGADAASNLDVIHGPLVNLFAILIPEDLGHGTPSDAAVEHDVLTSLQGGHLVWSPLDLRGNWRTNAVRNLPFII